MAVENSDEFQPVSANAVRNDVGSAGYDKLPCTQDSTGSAHLRLSLKEFDGFQDALGYKCCVLLRVFCDVVSQ